jgi:hypothetical protein
MEICATESASESVGRWISAQPLDRVSSRTIDLGSRVSGTSSGGRAGCLPEGRAIAGIPAKDKGAQELGSPVEPKPWGAVGPVTGSSSAIFLNAGDEKIENMGGAFFSKNGTHGVSRRSCGRTVVLDLGYSADWLLDDGLEEGREVVPDMHGVHVPGGDLGLPTPVIGYREDREALGQCRQDAAVAVPSSSRQFPPRRSFHAKDPGTMYRAVHSCRAALVLPKRLHGMPSMASA